MQFHVLYFNWQCKCFFVGGGQQCVVLDVHVIGPILLQSVSEPTCYSTSITLRAPQLQESSTRSKGATVFLLLFGASLRMSRQLSRTTPYPPTSLKIEAFSRIEAPVSFDVYSKHIHVNLMGTYFKYVPFDTLETRNSAILMPMTALRRLRL
jgi:hypothetical protein